MFKNISLKSKLVFLVVFPLLGVLFISGKSFMSDYSQYKALKSLKIGVELSTKLSALVHETQKERGMTAGFIGSKGKKFANKIIQQRELTNNRLLELKQYVISYDFQNINQDLSDVLSVTLKRFTKLESIRSKVDNLSISLGNVLKYYTTTNARILDTVSNIIKSSSDKIITRQLSAYSNFLLA